MPSEKCPKKIPTLSLPEEIAAPLLAFFKANARDLPWRRTRDPYAIWVSEIMLQQTRVEAVKPYYERFIAALPDPRALADVADEPLYKLWEGLGYYSRVRNMRAAAQKIVGTGDGSMPRTAEELAALPGIGSYTAGAIASIAYGEAVPAVDGNVLRVVARLCEYDENILDPAFKAAAEAALLPLIPRDGSAGTFNQALIELGALICLPNGANGIAPRCEHCPLAHLCRAKKSGKQYDLPIRLSRTEKKEIPVTVLVLLLPGRNGEDPGRVVLRRRPEKGLLAGLYEFPTLDGHPEREEVLAAVRAWGLDPIRVEPLPDAKHIFTHRIWQMHGFRVILADDLILPTDAQPGDLFAVPRQVLDERYPLPSAFSAYRKFI